MPTCIIYYRVSTKGQEDKWSLPAQRSELTALAQKNNWQVLKEYTEVASGKNIKDRVVIQQLIEDIPSLAPDYICVVEQDRLSRGDDFFYLIKTILRDSGIKIATPAGVTDLEIEEDDLKSDLFAIISKFERRKTITRMRRALIEKAKSGYHHGLSPLGYDLKNNVLIINESEAAIIKKIFELYLSGYSTTKIHNYLIENNIKGKKGQNITIVGINYILKNRTYIGENEYNGEYFKSKHKPIINKDTFEAVQKLLKLNYPGIRGNNYFLKNLIFCGLCGSAMTTAGAPMRSGKVYVYYMCKHYNKSYDPKGQRNCKRVRVSKRKVDNYIEDLIIQKLKELRPELSKQKEPSKVEINKKEIRSLEKKIRVLETDYYVHGKLNKERFEEIKEDLIARKKALENIKTEDIDYSYLLNVDFDLFRNAILEEKRQVACLIIKKIVVSPSPGSYFDPGRLYVEFNI